MPLKSGQFTKQEQVFTRALAETGSPVAAANRAKYKSTKALDKANDPAIIRAVEAMRVEFLTKTAMPLAMAAHLELLQAPTPAAVRATMVKLTYDEHGKLLGVGTTNGKDQAEWTSEELALGIQRLEILKAAKAVDITPVENEEGIFD
jgi:hypothetical protein